jgi:hypothetical protein
MRIQGIRTPIKVGRQFGAFSMLIEHHTFCNLSLGLTSGPVGMGIELSKYLDTLGPKTSMRLPSPMTRH